MDTTNVISEENKTHERTAFPFLKKKAAKPLTKGTAINKTGIICYFEFQI